MSIFATIMRFFPYVLQAVMAVEAAIGSAPGATKKQVVLSAVDAAAKVGATVDQPTAAAIGATIDAAVTTLNATGIFSHAGAPTA